MRKRLERLNRWEVHAAEEIQIAVNDVSILLQPQPHLVSAAKVGVGACLWDSSIVLTAYLGTCGNLHAHLSVKLCGHGCTQ